MVIKEITPLRKQEFKKHISGIISHLNELHKLGVNESEVFDFFYRWIHNEEIFTAKFYRNKEDTNFIYESNFPKHFDYFKIFITETQTSETEEKEETNSKRDEKPTENNSSEFVKTKKPKLKLDKEKPQKKKRKKIKV